MNKLEILHIYRKIHDTLLGDSVLYCLKQNLIKGNKGVKIRYLRTLTKRWVTDFEFFAWNPPRPVRTFT